MIEPLKKSAPPEGPWMQTYSGKAVELLNPLRQDILLGDIAHHLAMECRFVGATKFHYSVAQHSYYAFQMAREFGLKDLDLLLELLLHDAHEAYTKDIHAPLKWAMEEMFQTESPLEPISNYFDSLIRSMWQLPQIKTSLCHHYDMRMLFTERAQLLGPPPFPWHNEGKYEPFDLKIVQWTPTMAEKTWFLAVKDITEARFKKGAPK